MKRHVAAAPGRAQSGFTLIELITVIVILGILSAFALPRFAGLEAQARTAAVEGVAGSLRSGAALAHALYLAQGLSGITSVTMEGTVVTMSGNGYPTADAAGIGSVLQDASGFNLSVSGGGDFDYSPSSATDPTNCRARYTNPGTPGVSPVVVVSSTGC